MCSHLLILIAALVVFANQCRSQEGQTANPAARGTNSLSALEAQVVGAWRVDFPEAEQDGTNVFLNIQLSADRSWSWSVHSENPRTDPNKQSGTWFVHDRVLVLRSNSTDPRLWPKMAFPFDIKSITPQTIVVTNSPLGDRTWTRIAQRDGAANRSQPVRSRANPTSGAAGSGR
jgi:hypothetical protein